MSYATHKGYLGEKELESYLTDLFREFGYEFMRVGGVEKQKKVFGGDVVINPRTSKGRGEDCVLQNILLENKRQANIRIWEDAAKARDDARWHGKHGFILFCQLQPKGEKINGRKLAVMDWETLGRLLRELQGFREEYAQKAGNGPGL